MESVGLFPVLAVSAVLFATGVGGVLTRKNALIVFMSVELMLNAVNLSFVAFSRHAGVVDGQVFALFVMAVAAAEAAVGLALVILLFRNRVTVSLDDLDLMKG
ncbi:MAG: NADH-quinone oxidoreductase subunit NuoK [Pseudomonadota bacterium]|jgi:NADH-quinone oxidoreductase subunit K|nr:NADH-quinone oxidoreductase subunit NuoK [Pseudomonadota bacterium]